MVKFSKNSRVIQILELVFDVMWINFAFGLIDWLNKYEANVLFVLVFILTWAVSGFLTGIYNFTDKWSVKEVVGNAVQTYLLQLLIVTLILFWLRDNNVTFLLPSLKSLFAISLIAITMIVISRLVVKLALKYFEFYGFNQRKIVIIGTGSSGQALHAFFKKELAAGYKLVGFFDDNPNPSIQKDLILGAFRDVKDYCLNNEVDEIYFALPPTYADLMNDFRSFAENNVIYFRYAPDFYDVVKSDFNIYLYNSTPVLTTRKEPLDNMMNAIAKRAFDVVFSLLVIVLIFPWLFPVIAIAIRMESKGLVFFKQLRPGKKNKLFECYKFRTMRVNNDTERQATKNDSRVTKVGAFLRKTSLDELPQFFNVLIGNMSVVGPRPNMISQLEEYSQKIHNYKTRHFINPGITGYAQVSGYRGETQQLELMEKRVEYDIEYIENWSFSLDMKIIARTVWNMLKGEKNAY